MVMVGEKDHIENKLFKKCLELWWKSQVKVDFLGFESHNNGLESRPHEALVTLYMHIILARKQVQIENLQ